MNWKRIILYGVAAWILFLVLATLFGGKNKSSTPPATTVQETIPAAKKVTPSLGMTSGQFRQSFNKIANSVGAPSLLIGNIDVQVGDKQNVGQYNFSSSLILQCVIDKSTGLIKEVWLTSQPQSVDQIIEMIMAYGLVMSTLNPELSSEQLGEVLIDLKLTPDTIAQLNNEQFEVVRGNVRYIASKVTPQIFFLVASAKDL